MKNTFLIFIAFILTLSSCSKSDIPQCEDCEFDCLVDGETDVITNACLSNYTCSFKVLNNSQFSREVSEGFEKGNKTVFQMVNETQGDLRIADDEYTNILVFELDADQSSFKVSGKDLEKLKVHYKTVCFCLEVKFIAASGGCLQGKKQPDGSWFVQGKLTIPFSYGEKIVKIDAKFQ